MSTSEPPEESPPSRPDSDRAADSAEFDALVAGWKAEGTVPAWPDRPPMPDLAAELDPKLDPEEHYVPPEPPPLPRIGAAVAVGLVLVALGIVLVAAPQWIGLSSVYGLPLGLVAIAGGLTWLLMRLWQPAGTDDPYGDDGTI